MKTSFLFPPFAIFALIGAWVGTNSFHPVHAQALLDRPAATQRSAPLATLPPHASTAMQGMVATVSPAATDVAVEVMKQGGNAVDAAVAAALMLGVVDAHNSGLGGGCLILIRRQDGRVVAIDGREMAPAAAHRDMYIIDGKLDPQASKTGPLASGVPGALAAYALALKEHGSQPLAELITPAADVAEKGFVLSKSGANRLASIAEIVAHFPASRKILLHEDGSPYQAGEMMRNPDLAKSYRAIAEHGPDWFYRGPFAKSVADWMSKNGGIITQEDFANYVPRQRAPIRSKFGNYEIVGFPPPSSGGVHVAQILNILDNFSIDEIYHDNPARVWHVVAEAMKLAFADRAYWLGDADFVDVPRGLTATGYAEKLSERIELDRAIEVEHHGTPPDADTDFLPRHTTHIAAADADGNWVAITATVNTTYGSKVIVPGTGIVLNNEMDDFSIQPGTPNAFGLVGAENNRVQPGKRPLSSMSPTIVLDKEGEPVMTVGAAGGPKIITQVLLTIFRTLKLGESLPAAVAAPRIHHQWLPNHLSVEKSIDRSLLEELKQLGHPTKFLPAAGVTQAIGRGPEGALIGVHDPRVKGKAAGF